MVSNRRRGHDAALKAKVALEALKEEMNLAQFSSEFGVHVKQIRRWRQRLIGELPSLFSDRRKKKDKEGEELLSELHPQIGQLKGELEWLKKNPKCSS
jgi:transposase-like protein